MKTLLALTTWLYAARERQEELQVHGIAISSRNWRKQMIRTRKSDSTYDGWEELVYKSSKYNFSAGKQFDSLGEDSISWALTYYSLPVTTTGVLTRLFCLIAAISSAWLISAVFNDNAHNLFGKNSCVWMWGWRAMRVFQPVSFSRFLDYMTSVHS